MAQKCWPDNAVISGRRTAPYAADSGVNAHKFQALARDPLAHNRGSPPPQPDPALLVIPTGGTEPAVTRALLIEWVIADRVRIEWLD